MEEIWKDIIGYENKYQISNWGRVRSIDRVVLGKNGRLFPKKGVIIKPKPNRTNHCQVGLVKNGKTYYPLIHRLEWEAFNGPIPDGMFINHIDENPLNNRLDNLNLMTPKENTNWGTGIERRAAAQSKNKKGKCLYAENPNAKPVLQYSKEGDFVKEWDCIKSAADYYDITYVAIWNNIRGKTKLCQGCIWKYKEDAA